MLNVSWDASQLHNIKKKLKKQIPEYEIRRLIHYLNTKMVKKKVQRQEKG